MFPVLNTSDHLVGKSFCLSVVLGLCLLQLQLLVTLSLIPISKVPLCLHHNIQTSPHGAQRPRTRSHPALHDSGHPCTHCTLFLFCDPTHMQCPLPGINFLPHPPRQSLLHILQVPDSKLCPANRSLQKKKRNWVTPCFPQHCEGSSQRISETLHSSFSGLSLPLAYVSSPPNN